MLPKRRKIKPVVSSGPSASRIAARGKRSEPPSRTHPIPLHKPGKAETDDSEIEVYASTTDAENNPDDSITPPPTNDSASVSKHSISIVKKKRVFVTRRVGLKNIRGSIPTNALYANLNTAPKVISTPITRRDTRR